MIREINGHIAAITRRTTSGTERNGFLCECPRFDCGSHVPLTIDDYDLVRSRPRWFLIAPSDDHFTPEGEIVVSRRTNVWIIERTGIGAEIAEEAARGHSD